MADYAGCHMRQQLVNLIHLLRRQPHQYVLQITTADALTLLLHAICAAIEEETKWLSESEVGVPPLTRHGNTGHECSRHHGRHHATTEVVGII